MSLGQYLIKKVKTGFHKCEDNLTLITEDLKSVHYSCNICGRKNRWWKVDMIHQVFEPQKGITNGRMRKSIGFRGSGTEEKKNKLDQEKSVGMIGVREKGQIKTEPLYAEEIPTGGTEAIKAISVEEIFKEIEKEEKEGAGEEEEEEEHKKVGHRPPIRRKRAPGAPPPKKLPLLGVIVLFAGFLLIGGGLLKDVLLDGQGFSFNTIGQLQMTVIVVGIIVLIVGIIMITLFLKKGKSLAFS